MKNIVFALAFCLCFSASPSYGFGGGHGFKERKILQNKPFKNVYSKNGKIRQYPNKTTSIRILTPHGEIVEQTRLIGQGRNLTAINERKFTQGQTTISIVETTNFKQPRKQKYKR